MEIYINKGFFFSCGGKMKFVGIYRENRKCLYGSSINIEK